MDYSHRNCLQSCAKVTYSRTLTLLTLGTVFTFVWIWKWLFLTLEMSLKDKCCFCYNGKSCFWSLLTNLISFHSWNLTSTACPVWHLTSKPVRIYISVIIRCFRIDVEGESPAGRQDKGHNHHRGQCSGNPDGRSRGLLVLQQTISSRFLPETARYGSSSSSNDDSVTACK